jgi:hypothetical protein
MQIKINNNYQIYALLDGRDAEQMSKINEKIIKQTGRNLKKRHHIAIV